MVKDIPAAGERESLWSHPVNGYIDITERAESNFIVGKR
jgi:hypothetical protein